MSISNEMVTTRYRLRCRTIKCNEFVISHKYKCDHCGSFSAYLENNNPSDSSLLLASCKDCGWVIRRSAELEACGICNGGIVGWWSIDKAAWWRSDILPLFKQAESVWIKGDFTGDASGQPGHQSAQSGDYTLSFQSGRIKNPVVVDGPPKVWPGEKVNPWLQQALPEVVIEYGAEKKQVVTTLYDFALYDWEKIDIREVPAYSPFDQASAIGRFKGTCYGAIIPQKRSEDGIEPSSPAILNASSLMPGALSDVIIQSPSELKSELNQSAPLSDGINMQNSRGIFHRAIKNIHDCFLCRAWGLGTIGILLLLLTHSFFFTALALSGIWWFFCRLSPSPNILPITQSKSPSLFLCNIWVLGLISLIFYLFSHSLWVALFGVFGIGWLVCALTPFFSTRFLIGDPLDLFLKLFLIFLSLVGIWLMLGGMSWSPCHSAYSWAFLLPLIAFLGTMFFVSFFSRILLLGLWILAMLLFSVQQSSQCGSSMLLNGNLGSLTSGINNIDTGINDWMIGNIDHISEISNSLIYPSTSLNDSNSDSVNAVNQVTAASGEPPKISLNQVVNNPGLLSDCKNKIYFPNATSFAHDSDHITPEFEHQLELLSKLHDQYPNRVLIITGHSDRMGDETEAGVVHNLDLSKRRADAVANWFATHSQWMLEQMQVDGVGSDAPLLDLPGDVPVNRRVEINLNCQ